MNDNDIRLGKIVACAFLGFVFILSSSDSINKAVAAYFKSKENQAMTLVIKAEGFKADDVLTRKK